MYENNTGCSIEVRESPDIPGIVCILTDNKASEEYFGGFRIEVDTKMAKLLAEAIQKQVEFIEGRNNKYV